MPKIAELHDGTQIHFPDTTPDQHMDSAVQRHLGIQPPTAPGSPEMVQALLSTFAQHLTNQKQAGDAQALQGQNVAQGQMQQAQDLHMASLQQADAHHSALLDALGQIVSPVIEALHVLAQNGQALQALPDIIRAINNLAQTVATVGKAYISVASAPKELYHHADGKPKGLRSVVGKTIGEML